MQLRLKQQVEGERRDKYYKPDLLFPKARALPTSGGRGSRKMSERRRPKEQSWQHSAVPARALSSEMARFSGGRVRRSRGNHLSAYLGWFVSATTTATLLLQAATGTTSLVSSQPQEQGSEQNQLQHHNLEQQHQNQQQQSQQNAQEQALSLLASNQVENLTLSLSASRQLLGQPSSISGGGSGSGVTSQAPPEDSMKFPLYMRILATFACLLIFGVGVCGNLLVPIVVIKTKYLRNSTNLFLINLALADLLVLIICEPTVLIELHSRPETWLLGEPMCKYTNLLVICL